VLDDPALIRRLAAGAGDKALHERIAAVKRANKVALSRLVSDHLGLSLNPDALFDVHIKRIHEYKRQLLNILETVALYRALRDDPTQDFVPRVKIFAGKAAASYAKAKLILKLINEVARVINSDLVTRDLLRVVFLPDYNVSLAEVIIPAADLSEQISTAGMEASGTGNMKLALNGALTIGTLDGANIEIREHVGADNIFIFGLNAQEVEERRRHDMSAALASSPDLAHAIEAVEAGVFGPGEEGQFAPLMSQLRYQDYYMVTADFDDYYATQRRVEMLWRSQFDWTRTSIMNIGHMAWFSSDRAIGEYARDIWEVPFTMPADAVPSGTQHRSDP
jgi:glycogen phosphorylase